ncbi:MAG: response regulator [Gloeobacteraceae cyanobacterium ES-bin-316]|nr:response regulator [Ferruginibacter sp.]
MKTSDKFLPIDVKLNIFLADDDKADCLLFKEALEELPVSAKLTTFENGEQLMERLTKKQNKLPDVLFLDLNMPRKNGFITLGEIKRNNELDSLPVIIFSTALEQDKVKQVFRDAAHYYIRKPTEFSELKKIIYEALTLIIPGNNPLPEKGKFILTGDLKSIPGEIKPPQKKPPRKIN